MDSVFWDILVAIRDQIRTNIAFQGFGEVSPIPPENVVIRMPPPYGKRDGGEMSEELTPGIIICPGRRVENESTGGMMSVDDIRYHILIQMIDREFSVYEEDRLRSWLKWQEQVRKYFCNGNLKNAVWEDKGYVEVVYCPRVDAIDSAQFYLYAQCIGMVYLIVESREQRDVLGTN